MDFAREVDAVRSFLTQSGFRVAVIGGVALAGYGHPRLTLDLDIVTEAAAQDALVAMMESEGFVTLHRSAGYSNHRHPDRNRGRVDVMYVRGETSDRLFASARDLPGPGGGPMAVPKPEHLIAMKVQAIKDAPERTWQDLADIGFLVRIDGVDREDVRATSCERASRRSGMNWPEDSETGTVDFARDVPHDARRRRSPVATTSGDAVVARLDARRDRSAPPRERARPAAPDARSRAAVHVDVLTFVLSRGEGHSRTMHLQHLQHRQALL